MSALSFGYIRNPVADWFWFVLLPGLSVGFALLSEAWLSFVALASVNLWVTVPHHYGTWCRTYGLGEDWKRFQTRVIVGPILIIAAIVSGFLWAPLTIAVITLLWDHQHSLMQQHGLARIYDFKAKAGGPNMAKLDLWLNLFLYGNVLLTVPLWTEIWVQQCYAWQFPLNANQVRWIQWTSYCLTGLFLLFYTFQVAIAISQGHKLNPMKYAFLISSYALWYYAGWHSNSLLVYGIAHKMMHGLQYLVFVYWFLERKQASNGAKPWMLPKLNRINFVLVGIAYAIIIQLLLLRPMTEFAFGLFSLNAPPAPLSLEQSTAGFNRNYELYAATIIQSTAIIHYYFDSFIWKIRDERNQRGL
jgi:hypothetical protein